MIFMVNIVWGQQVIGAFPEMDGGYENQTAGALTQLASLATGAQSNLWTINSTTTTVASITATGGRSGPKYVTFSSTTAAARRLQSPTAANAAIANATAYTLQYFYKTPAATNQRTKKRKNLRIFLFLLKK